MKKLIQCHLISGHKSTYLRSLFQRYILLCDRHRILKFSTLQNKHSCHDLRDAGRINPVVDSLRVKDFVIAEIKQ